MVIENHGITISNNLNKNQNDPLKIGNTCKSKVQ